MEYKLPVTLEEISLLRNSLDVIQIQGKNARMVATLQDKTEEGILQLQMNIKMEEERRLEEERLKMEELQQIQSQTAPTPKPASSRVTKK